MAYWRDLNRRRRARPALASLDAPAVAEPVTPRSIEPAGLSFAIEGPREHGGDDYEPATDHNYLLAALDHGQSVGRLDFDAEPDGDILHVRWVEVDESCRRQGVGRALLREALRRWPDRELETNGFTAVGEEFWAAEPWLELEPASPAPTLAD